MSVGGRWFSTRSPLVQAGAPGSAETDDAAAAATSASEALREAARGCLEAVRQRTQAAPSKPSHFERPGRALSVRCGRARSCSRRRPRTTCASSSRLPSRRSSSAPALPPAHNAPPRWSHHALARRETCGSLAGASNASWGNSTRWPRTCSASASSSSACGTKSLRNASAQTNGVCTRRNRGRSSSRRPAMSLCTAVRRVAALLRGACRLQAPLRPRAPMPRPRRHRLRRAGERATARL